MSNQGWSEYLAAAMRKARLSQAQLAQQSGVGDGVISRWLKDEGGTQPAVDNLRKLVGPLKVSLLELLVAAGHLEPREAKMQDRPKITDSVHPTIEQWVEDEPSLGPREKEHFIQQFALLQNSSSVGDTTVVPIRKPRRVDEQREQTSDTRRRGRTAARPGVPQSDEGLSDDH